MSIPDPTPHPKKRHVTEKNNFAYLAVVLVLLLFGLALIHELELAPGEVAVETAMIAVLVASLVGSVLAKKQNR